MVKDKDLDIFVNLLATEQGARAFLKDLIESGIKVNVEPDNLSHDDLIKICSKIIQEIYYKDRFKPQRLNYLH